jgi:hypothetical protein
MNSQNTNYRIGIYAASINIAGILLSGPLGLLVVSLVKPAPAWQTPAQWAAGYHPVQTLPFYFGFLLVFSYIAMIAVAHRIAGEEHKTYTLIALVFTAAFVPLIFFNYINQTTFLPALARSYRPEFDALISAFSLNNPNALCWAIEMWGYALLGMATIFAAPVFNRNRTEKITAWLMVINGVISLAGGFLSAVNLSWVLTLPGLINYMLWNGLVLVMAIFFLLSLRRRSREALFQGEVIGQLALAGLPASGE